MQDACLPSCDYPNLPFWTMKEGGIYEVSFVCLLKTIVVFIFFFLGGGRGKVPIFFRYRRRAKPSFPFCFGTIKGGGARVAGWAAIEATNADYRRKEKEGRGE